MHIYKICQKLKNGQILEGKLAIGGLKVAQNVKIKRLFSVKFRGEHAYDG